MSEPGTQQPRQPDGFIGSADSDTSGLTCCCTCIPLWCYRTVLPCDRGCGPTWWAGGGGVSRVISQVSGPCTRRLQSLRLRTILVRGLVASRCSSLPGLPNHGRLVPGSCILFPTWAVLRLPPSASRTHPLLHDVRFDQLAPSPSPVSLQMPSWWQPHTHTHMEGSAVAAAAGGQPSGMIPLISSHLILVSSAPSPAQPCLAAQGRDQQFVQSTLSALSKVPSKPQLSGKRSHCHTTHTPPLPCCHLRSLEVGIVMDSDSLVARPRREEPETRRCMSIYTQTYAHVHSSVSQSVRQTALAALSQRFDC